MADDFIERAIRADADLRADPAAWQKACADEQQAAWQATNARLEMGKAPIAIGLGHLVNAAFVLRTVNQHTEANAEESFRIFREAFLLGPE